jgi:hypothetical protein
MPAHGGHAKNINELHRRYLGVEHGRAYRFSRPNATRAKSSGIAHKRNELRILWVSERERYACVALSDILDDRGPIPRL